MAGIKILHVPYKGNAAAITALISGEVQRTISDAGLFAAYQGGQSERLGGYQRHSIRIGARNAHCCGDGPWL